MRFLRRLFGPPVSFEITYNLTVQGDMGPAAVARLDQLLAEHDRNLARLVRSVA